MIRHDTSIARIAPLPPAEFEKEYLLPGRPVILTGLFAHEPLARLATREDAERELGQVQIVVGEEFTRNMLDHQFQATHNPPRGTTVREYLRFVDAHPQTRLLCSEFRAPAEIRELYRLPEFTESQGLPEDALTMMFLGNAGNFAHLHFDGDYRQVVLYQVFGRKRVVLIPPDSGNKLLPVGNFSQVSLENFRGREIEDFLQYVGGYECLLEQGETIYIPAGWWHFLEYTDTAMSINVRFGRNAHTKTLGDKCHPNAYLQCIASRMVDARAVEQEPLRSHLAAIRQALAQPCVSPLEKGKRMEAEFRRICLELNPDFGRTSHFELPSPVREGYLELLSRSFYPAAASAPVPVMPVGV